MPSLSFLAQRASIHQLEELCDSLGLVHVKLSDHVLVMHTVAERGDNPHPFDLGDGVAHLGETLHEVT